eukprot:4923620-Amphidinium_carterae.1
MPRQLAGKVVGMNKERAFCYDVHFGQTSFQIILPHTKKGHRSTDAWQQPSQTVTKTHDDVRHGHPARRVRD